MKSSSNYVASKERQIDRNRPVTHVTEREETGLGGLENGKVAKMGGGLKRVE